MKYDVERAVVMLSVTELCARATVEGDLDLRFGKSRFPSPARAAEGVKIHKKLQRASEVRYDAEVPLSLSTVFGGLTFEVSGRADGILHTEPPTLHEIKSVSGRSPASAPLPAHVAQLKCYAYFAARTYGLDRIRARLTYCRVEDEKTHDREEEYGVEELERFYLSLLARIEFSARVLREHQTVRIPSAKGCHFPYSSVRAGQDILLRECYRDIRAGKRLFAEAPTGTGKTISTLYPAVRALGDGVCDKIFYLTAKASTRREAYRAAEQLFRAGAQLRTVVLTSREQLCRNAAAKEDPSGISQHCNPYDCPYAKGFFDRCDHAVCEGLSHQNGFQRTSVLALAERFRICPYEFQLALSEYCDIIVCDYNYAFDPQIYLRRYFDAEGADSAGRYVFLIDEAHNLADRAASMYSSQISNAEIERVLQLLPREDRELRPSLEKLLLSMHSFPRLCQDNLHTGEDGITRGYYISQNPLESFHTLLQSIRPAVDVYLRTHPSSPEECAVRTLSASLKRFLTVAEYYERGFMTFIELERELYTLRLICLDPSRILDTCLSRARASVLFSATLTPLDYFADILGGGKGAVRISLPSPFEADNLCLVAVPTVDTRLEARASSYKKIASLIAATASGRSGNYIVYFPSYDYMEQVHRAFTERYPRVTTILQTRGMGASDKEAFLSAFREDDRLRIGFCVLGGSFSEGVDLPGRQLIGTVIVGTGLPGISNERNILKEYYDVTRERGFDYAYVYPGMNRVLQAAGRVIRREEDRGVVVLIDARFESTEMHALFPDHWSHLQYAGNAKELANSVAEFWRGIEKSE